MICYVTNFVIEDLNVTLNEVSSKFNVDKNAISTYEFDGINEIAAKYEEVNFIYDKKLIVVTNATKILDLSKTALANLVERLSQWKDDKDSIALFLFDKVAPKSLAAIGEQINIASNDATTFMGIINDFCKAKKITIDAAGKKFLEKISTSKQNLMIHLDKIEMLGNKSFTLFGLKNVFAQKDSYAIFSLINSLFRQDFNSYFATYNELVSYGVSDEEMLYKIANDILLMDRIRVHLSFGYDDFSIVNQLKIKEYRYMKLKENLSNLGREQMSKVILEMFNVEFVQKTSRTIYRPVLYLFTKIWGA